MAVGPPTVRRMRAIACLAVAGTVPLTAGTILWVVATVMRRSAPRGWGGTAVAGEVMVLAGLVCGLALIIAAAVWQRTMPRVAGTGAAEPQSRSGQALTPLTPPEQHAYPAGRPPAPPYPQPQAAHPPADASRPGYPRPEGQAPASPQPPPADPGRPR